MSSPNQDPTSDSDSEFEIVQDYRAKWKQAKEEARDTKEQLEEAKKNFEVYQDNYKLMEGNFKESLAAKEEKVEEEKKRADKLAEELEELKKLTEERSGEVGQLESSALEVKNLKDQLATQDESRRILSEEMDEMLQQKKDAEEKLQASQAECTHLRSEAETLRNEVLLKHSETEGLMAQLQAVQGEAAKVDEKKFGDLFHKSMEDESIRAILESENAVLQRDLEELKSSSAKQIMEKEDMVQALLAENENLAQQNTQLRQESESNRMLADECTATNLQLVDERDRTTESFARAEQEKTRLEGRIAEMQEQSQLAAQNRSPQATPANAHPGPTPAPADGPAPAAAPADGPAPAAAGN